MGIEVALTVTRADRNRVRVGVVVCRVDGLGTTAVLDRGRRRRQTAVGEMSVGAEFDALQPEDTDHDRQTTALTRAAYGVANNLEIDFSAPVIYLQNTVEPNAGGY